MQAARRGSQIHTPDLEAYCRICFNSRRLVQQTTWSPKWGEVVAICNAATALVIADVAATTQLNLSLRATSTAILIECLHDPANVQQTSSKFIQNTRELLDVCWTFAGLSLFSRQI